MRLAGKKFSLPGSQQGNGRESKKRDDRTLLPILFHTIRLDRDRKMARFGPRRKSAMARILDRAEGLYISTCVNTFRKGPGYDSPGIQRITPAMSAGMGSPLRTRPAFLQD